MKKAWWIGGVVVVIAVVIVVFVATKGSHSASPMVAGETQQGVAADATTTSGSFKDLITSGKSESCTYADTSGTTTINGTVYVSNGQMKGDVTTTTNGKVTAAHIVAKTSEKLFYTWIDGMTTGYKISLDTVMQTGSSTTSTSTHAPSYKGVDANKVFNYQCQSWTPDATSFSLPSTITFTDVSAMMGSMKMPADADTSAHASAGASATSGSCSQCASAPAQYQAACRQAMHC